MYRFYFNCHQWKPTCEQWIYATQCLPIDEIHRINQYAYKRDTKFTLIGQLLTRYLLRHVFQNSTSDVEIQRTQNNRPFVDSKPSFDFNLSHHHHLVCIAGTLNGQIGCDTIFYDKKEIRKEILRKKFTRQELDYIHENPMNFHRLWCLKESYVKYLGVGIGGYELLKLNFHLQTKHFPTNRFISDTSLNSSLLRFDEELLLKENHLITLCLEKSNPYSVFLELKLDEIFHVCQTRHDQKEFCLQSWKLFENKF